MHFKDAAAATCVAEVSADDIPLAILLRPRVAFGDAAGVCAPGALQSLSHAPQSFAPVKITGPYLAGQSPFVNEAARNGGTVLENMIIKPEGQDSVFLPMALREMAPLVQAWLDNEYAVNPHARSARFTLSFFARPITPETAQFPNSVWHGHRVAADLRQVAKNAAHLTNGYLWSNVNPTPFAVGPVVRDSVTWPVTGGGGHAEACDDGESVMFGSADRHRTWIREGLGKARAVMAMLSYPANHYPLFGTNNPVLETLRSSADQTGLLSAWQGVGNSIVALAHIPKPEGRLRRYEPSVFEAQPVQV